MASIFCPDCGAKNHFTLKKPNFCQSCGETFSAFGMAKGLTVKSESSASSRDEDSVPNISKLEYEIDLPKSKVTIETLVNNPINPEEIAYNAEATEGYKKMTKEDFLKVSQRECGSSRGNYEDVGGSAGQQ